MRDAMAALGGDPSRIDPLIPAELVIDHSVQVDDFASRLAIRRNAELEFQPQPRALRVPAVGPGRVRGSPGRAAEHRHLPPGEPRVPRPGRRGARRAGVPGHARRHRLAHDDGQRPRRPRLGRRRDRGRGGDARGVDLDARAAGRRLPAPRRAARGGDGDRPRPHRDRDPAADGRGREVRRVLRRGPRRAPARRPGDDREHVARVRRDVRLLPGRRRDAPLPPPHGSQRRARRARRGVLQGEHALARRRRSPRRTRRSSSSTSRPSSRRWRDRAGRRTGSRCARAKASFHEALASFGVDYGNGLDEAVAESFPASDPPGAHRAGRPRAAAHRGGGGRARGDRADADRRDPLRARRRGRAPRARRGRDRGDHVVHEHLEPVGDGRRGPSRQEGRRAGPRPEAVGQVEPRARARRS